MKKIKLLLYTAALSLGLSAPALADQATYDFRGWSADGRYLSFAQSGFNGGSGFAYTELFIVDNLKNILVQRFYKQGVEGSGSDTEQGGLALMKQVYNQAAPTLKRFGIDTLRGGVVQWNKPVAGLAVNFNPPSSQPFQLMEKPKLPEPQAFSVKNSQVNWQFRLSHIPLKPEQFPCLSSNEDSASVNRGFSLEMTAAVAGKTSTKMLQKDIRVPASRACAFYYIPTEIRTQGNYLSVTMAVYSTDGFEAETLVRYIVVTAKKP